MRLSIATHLPFNSLADLPPEILATYLAALDDLHERS